MHVGHLERPDGLEGADRPAEPAHPGPTGRTGPIVIQEDMDLHQGKGGATLGGQATIHHGAVHAAAPSAKSLPERSSRTKARASRP
jgi:hypothetical protein